MAPLSSSTAQSPAQPALRSWIQFALLTVLLTGGAILLLRLLRPSALRGLFSRSDPAEVRRGQAQSNLKWIDEALLVYAHEHQGQYPARLDELVVPGPDGKTCFGAQREVPLDPWQRAFRYEPPTGAHPRPRIWSLGADGEAGGEGENADLDSDSLLLDR
jgi:general secretion pathway protein G